MDQDDKDRLVERYLRGSSRFEQRKKNLAERKRRGRPPRSRMRGPDLQDDFENDLEDDEWEPEQVSRRSATKGEPGTRVDGVRARVAEVARTEVRVLDGAGDERVCRVTPRVLAEGGLVAGDDVTVDANDRIVERHERRTVLERRAPGNAHRTRTLAANVDVGLVVLAPRGEGLSLGFLDRAIAALEGGGIDPCVVVTKVDLVADRAVRLRLLEQLAACEQAGYGVHLVASPTGEGIDALRRSLCGRVTVLLGHSGVGKSTLVNALDPSAEQATGVVRERDGRGRHTTTASRLVPFLEGGALVDTPGVRELVPHVAGVDALARSVPELAPYLDRCRFDDCAHSGEPGCVVEAAAQRDPAVARALSRLRRLIESSQE